MLCRIPASSLIIEPRCRLQQLKVIQLVAVLHNVALDLAAHRPRHKVLGRSGDEVGRVRYRLDADTDVALLNHLGRGLHRLGHAQSRHDNGQAPAGKGTDGRAVLDGRELRRRRKDAHVVQLVEQQLLVLAADGIVGWEERQAVGELAQILQKNCELAAIHRNKISRLVTSRDRVTTYTANAIILLVVFGLLDIVSADNFLVAVSVVLLVGDEIRLPQELLLVISEFSHHLDGVG